MDHRLSGRAFGFALTGPCAAKALTRFAPPDQEHELVARAIEGRLRSSSYLALRSIHSVFRDGVVTLQGCLPTYYLKQLVFQIVTEVAGSHAISDQIEVISPLHHELIGTKAGRGATD